MSSLVDAIVTLAKGYASVSNIYKGSLPVAESISIYHAPSGENQQFFDKTSDFDSSFTFLAKYANQKTAMDKLDAIGKGLSQLTSFPVLDDVQIYNINYSTRVNYVDKDTDNSFIYSIVVDVQQVDK
jgi:hypothetical protein